MLLGASAVVEWYLDDGVSASLLGPHRPRLDEALGFIALGVALAARGAGLGREAAAAAVAGSLGAGLALAEMLGLDRMLARQPPPEQTLAWHMGAISATCFLLAAAGLLTVRRRRVVTWILGSSVLVVGAIAALGNLFGARGAASDSLVHGMPAASGLAFAVLGGGLVALAWPRTAWPEAGRDAGPGDPMVRYVPYLTGAVFLVGTLLFWQSLVAQQRTQVRRMVDMTAVSALAEIGTHLHGIVQALRHLAEWRESFGRPSARERILEARALLDRPGGPRIVDWIDADLEAAHTVIRRAGRAGVEIEDRAPLGGNVRPSLAAARDTRAPVVAITEPFESDRVALRVAVPLRRDGVFDGFVSGVLVVDEMLDELLAERARDFTLAVHSRDRQLYGPRTVRRGPCAWCSTRTLDLPGGGSWTIVVEPSRHLLASLRTALPELVLTGGTIISLLLVATLRLLQQTTLAAHELRAANRRLGEEIETRRRAEAEVRTLADDLERRIRERTAELAVANAALRAEVELRERARANLERANTDLRRFATFVSHELRQPLATMAIWTELLETQAGGALDERGRKYAGQLRNAINRMTSFLEAQLRLSRATYTQPTFEDGIALAAVVRAVADDLQLELQRARGTVEVGTLPVLRADGSQMRQLFRNLVENAIKYRRPDVPLVVRVEGDAAPRDQRDGRTVEVRVTDNGQGFAPQDAPHVFGLFRRLGKSAAGGSGVGLAICERIVEHHGGTIRAEGRPGSGATFVITLPADLRPAEAGPPETHRRTPGGERHGAS
jgi:signal transduction histidine kinase